MSVVRINLARQSRDALLVWALGIIIASLTIIAAGATVWEMRDRAIDDAKSGMRIQGVILADQASRYFQGIDLVLREVQSSRLVEGVSIPDDAPHHLSGEVVHLFLIEATKNIPQAAATRLFDAKGDLLNTSSATPLPQFNVADRDYFQHFRDHNDPGLFVGVPDTSHGSARLSIFLSRRISGPDGVFLGIAVTAVEVEQLRAFYERIDRAHNIGVTLLRRDGIVLARNPTIAGIGRSMPGLSPWYARVAAGGGTYISPGYLAADSLVVSVTPLSGYPLVIDASVREDEALSAWWRQSEYMATGGVALAATIIALFGLIARQMDRQAKHYAALAHTAEVLQESEGRLRDFAELASDWFWEQDADLLFTVVGVGSPIRGPDPSYLGQLRWEINETGKDPEGWEKHRRDVLAHQPFSDFRFERAGPDGLEHHVSISGKPLYNQSGVFVGYRGIGSDITMRMKAEQELRQQKERAEYAESLLQDAVGSMSEGFVIYDREDRFVMCNETYRKMYSECADLLVPGTSFEDFVRCLLVECENSDTWSREAEWLAERLRYHREAKGAMEQSLGDGSWILVTDRRMENGGIAGLRIDITALGKARTALHESNERLDRAQEIAGIGSWECNIESGEYIWSKHLYRIRGFPSEFQPTREALAATVHADDFQMVSKWLDGLQLGQSSGMIEFRAARPDGETCVLRIEGRAVVDPDGVVRRLIGTMQDVTERRLVARQLAHSQKMEAIGNLTGGMAHDFNNGLGVIIGNLDLLARLIKKDQTAVELCEEARDGAQRCADLIRRLLAFARQQPLDPRRVDVNALIRDVVRMLGRILGEGILVQLHLDDALWPTLTDPSQLEAALVNLATNARDAMPKGGRLDITTKNVQLGEQYAVLYPDVSPGAYVLIILSDTGTGIDPGIIGRVFDPFFTTKDMGKGSGLGLAMVFGFVKQLGGHVSVYSEAGIGSSFSIYLPRTDIEEVQSAMPVEQRSVVGGNETVLLVEDNAQLRVVTARQLAELGYKVREAEHAEAALAILAGAERLDLLFTDVVMPGTMDGVDLAHQATRLRQGLKILLASGFPGTSGIGRKQTKLPFPLLSKPYGQDELARAVRKVLDEVYAN